MLADMIGDVFRVLEEGPERPCMQPLHVIDLEKRVDDELPIGRSADRALTIKAVAAEFERLEIAVDWSEKRGDIRHLGLARIEHGPDEAVTQRRWQLPQATGRSVEGRKRLAPRHAHERAVEIVSPAVIVAG